MNDIEHPDITRAECTGYGRLQTREVMICPVCKEGLTEDDDVYIGENNDVIGCCYCVRTHPAAEEFYKE